MVETAEFCPFQAKIASRGYHVYKYTTWVDAREGDEVRVDIETNKESIKVDPYACAIRVKERFFGAMKTVGHIPREISRHAYFFIKNKRWLGQWKSFICEASTLANTIRRPRNTFNAHV